MDASNVDSSALMPYTIVASTSVIINGQRFDNVSTPEKIIPFIKAGIGPVAINIGNLGIVTWPGVTVNETYSSSQNLSPNPGYVINGAGLGMYYKNGIYGQTFGSRGG